MFHRPHTMPDRRNTRKLLLIILLLFPTIAFTLSITPSSWDTGKVEADSGVLSKSVIISNNETGEITLKYISTCGCLKSSKDEMILKPGESQSIIFSFDPSDESGEFEKYIIIKTSSEDMPKGFFKISGTVINSVKTDFRTGNNTENKSISIKYFYSAGCGECRKFLNNTIPELERKLGINITVDGRDILDPDIYREFMALLTPEEKNNVKIPSLLIGNTMLMGQQDIDIHLGKVLSENTAAMRVAENRSGKGIEAVSVITVLLAGLLDGINPCVFTTLLFLISSLTMVGKKRKEIFVIGIFFSSAVFVTYYLVGLGLFSGLRSINIFPLIAIIIKWVLVLSLLLISALSFYDYLLIRKGKEVEISLQLPRFLKLRIHSAIRKSSRTRALMTGAFSLGIIVSVFELACTGQIYFPTIAYMVKTGQTSAYLLLFVYNISFILPLVVVFALIFAGTGSVKITSFFRKNMGLMKISISFLFLLLAIILVTA